MLAVATTHLAPVAFLVCMPGFFVDSTPGLTCWHFATPFCKFAGSMRLVTTKGDVFCRLWAIAAVAGEEETRGDSDPLEVSFSVSMGAH